MVDRNTFIISDTHFGHESFCKYEPSRMDKVLESGYKNQDQMLIHRWNEVVSHDDTVLHLGDFCMQNPPRDILKKLNGKKILLRGNHDKGSASFHLAQGWNSLIEGINFSLKRSENEQRLLSLIQNDIATNRLAHSLLNCLILDYEDKRILFSHFPVFDDNPYDKKFDAITETLEEIYLLGECTLNIHGHVHSKVAKGDVCINACVEQIDFKPIELDKLIKGHQYATKCVNIGI
jgi:calcineurin-like phosphoesterase family protein